jgi:hypothetical protein
MINEDGKGIAEETERRMLPVGIVLAAFVVVTTLLWKFAALWSTLAVMLGVGTILLVGMAGLAHWHGGHPGRQPPRRLP